MNKKRIGFTLVELLVVIAIIGMLVALILPAVNAARESGRQATCMNNQKNIATALLANEMRKGKFTGYSSVLDGKRAGWPVMILPDLERRDLFDEWAQGNRETAYLEIFVCPSNPPANYENPSLSYAVNCGLPDYFVTSENSIGFGATLTDLDWKENGIFHAHVKGFGPPETKVRLADISKHDGSSNTLMLSENIGPNEWDGSDWSPDNAYRSKAEIEGGFVWDYTEPPDDSSFKRPINRDIAMKDIVDIDDVSQYAAALELARPHSRHSGGVLVAFADGHVVFIGDQISPLVYGLLCSPHGKKTKVPGKAKNNPSSLIPLRDLSSPIPRYAETILKESAYLD